MRFRQLYKQLNPYRRYVILSLAIAGIAVSLTLLQDFLHSSSRQSIYVLSESMLFSSFWFLFVPLIGFQYFIGIKNPHAKAGFWLGLFLTPLILHLLIYPLGIYLLSGWLLGHRYAYLHILGFALTEYLHIGFVIYALAAWMIRIISRKPRRAAQSAQETVAPLEERISRLLILEKGQQLVVDLAEIRYIVADPPYVQIHTADRKYLHKETLRVLESRLDPHQFVRIHKSVIVRTGGVQSFRSRHNGDYDLFMNDGAQFRVSRRYAASFRQLLKATPPVTS